MTLPKQTAKQQEIVKLHYRFRFLNSNQIQKFQNHKNKRRINSWLPDLVEKGYLNRIYDPHTFGKNTLPAVYYFGTGGIRYLKTQANLDPEVIRKLYKDKDRSDTFISDCQLLADICLDLKAQSKNGITFNWATASDYTSSDSPFYSFGFLKELSTKLLFTKEKSNKKNYYLLETLNTTLPAYRTRKKIRTYFEFLLNYDWMEHLKTPPEILFVCQTKDLLIRSKRFTKKLIEDEDKKSIHISFALEDEVRKYGATANIWDEVK